MDDFIGKKFGRLTVEKKNGRNKWGIQMYDYLCECGNRINTDKSSVKNGRTTSCGCYAKEVTSKNRKIHGMTEAKEYKVWEAMKNRAIEIRDNYSNSYKENPKKWVEDTLNNNYRKG